MKKRKRKSIRKKNKKNKKTQKRKRGGKKVSKSVYKKTKYIIFDLDETIGYFQDLGVEFQVIMNNMNNDYYKKEILFNLLSNNEEVFRFGIFRLFNMLKMKKNNNIKVVLFTNNQGPKYWYNYIVEYINKVLDFELFDYIIGPYKINNKIVEINRTSHNKSIYDLYNIFNISSNSAEFLMFDDQYHSNMLHEDVKFIHINPYKPPINETDIKEYTLMRNEILSFLK